ncbi:hypothetical protein HZS_6045 [Henneguya salminicola]|nr:hypothetical protein HZS_6045 [Henneguya salminicola]
MHTENIIGMSDIVNITRNWEVLNPNQPMNVAARARLDDVIISCFMKHPTENALRIKKDPSRFPTLSQNDVHIVIGIAHARFKILSTQSEHQ